MKYLPESNLQPVEEAEAKGDVARLYAEIKRDLKAPFLPNMFKTLAISPAALESAWGLYGSFLRTTTLPRCSATICWTSFQLLAWTVTSELSAAGDSATGGTAVPVGVSAGVGGAFSRQPTNDRQKSAIDQRP